MGTIMLLLVGGLSFMVGTLDQQSVYQEKCVAKYADMPHNKVENYCKTLLKFEPDPK